MVPDKLRAKIEANPLIGGKVAPATYGVVTNATYDGVCYGITKAESLLGPSVPRLHLDEAWYAYS